MQSVENQEDRVNDGENGVCLGGENRGFWGFGWRWLVRRATCAAGLVCVVAREVVREWSGGGPEGVFCGLRSAGCCRLPGTVCARRFCLRSPMWKQLRGGKDCMCVVCVASGLCVICNV